MSRQRGAGCLRSGDRPEVLAADPKRSFWYPLDLPVLPQVDPRPRHWLEQMLISRMRLLLTACLLAVAAVVSPLGESVALARPTAAFDWAPQPVVAGTQVTFTSTSTPSDSYTPITRAEWTIQGAGTFTRQPGNRDRPCGRPVDSSPSCLGPHRRRRRGDKGDQRPTAATTAATAATATTATAASAARESTSHSSPYRSSCVPGRRRGGDLRLSLG